MTDERIIAYLLEELPGDDLERFEDECFSQESWPTQQIELVEEELIDAYLRDELVPERRQRFERNYLTTEARQERVSIAAALLRRIDAYNYPPEPVDPVLPDEQTWADRFRAYWTSQARGLRATASVAIVAVVGGVLWLFIPGQSPPIFASLTLSISSNNRAEGAQVEKVKLPPNAEALNIFLTLPQQSPSAVRYRIELENNNGETKSAKIAGNDAQSVLVMVPAAQLARGQYALKLFAIKTDGTEQRINGSYFFVVE